MYTQGEAIQKQSMVPLQLYKTGTVSLRKSQWSLIDPGVLSPWRVMSWGMQQLRGFVVGSDSLASPRLQVQELVLVENLKETGDRVVKQALGSSSKMELVISKEGFMDSFATVLNGETELSEADFNVLLLYLSRDCGAIAYDGRVCSSKDKKISANDYRQSSLELRKMRRPKSPTKIRQSQASGR